MGKDNGFSGENMEGQCAKKIVIIGAGISGLAAAALLYKSGFTNVIVLEASDRIGGRISSVELVTVPGQKVELGANWIHGIDANPIYKVCMQNNLLANNKYEGRKLGTKVMFLTSDGEPVNTKLIAEVDMVFGMLMSECDEFYLEHVPTPMENDSVGAFTDREFGSKFSRYHGRDFDIRKRIMEHRMLWESIITGCPTLYDLSLSEVGSFEELAGIHFTIPNGFESVVKLFARQLPEESILFDQTVSSIVTKEDGSALVTCLSGAQFNADHVLTTVSLGCLQKFVDTLFHPPLPQSKREALDHLVIGTVNKIILEFDSQVLPDEVARLELIWDRSTLPEDDIAQSWMKKICLFEAVEKNVLMGWICGREAEYMETLSNEAIGEICVGVLKKFMARTGRQLPALQRVFVSRWKSNEFTMGSYTYIPVGAENRHIEALAEPVCFQNKPVLLFAGEATHHRFYSSSHGALLSGQREAERLIDFYAQ